MKAIEIQKQLNEHLADATNASGIIFYKKAIFLLKKLNDQRKKEGLALLSLPNVERRYKDLTLSVHA